MGDDGARRVGRRVREFRVGGASEPLPPGPGVVVGLVTALVLFFFGALPWLGVAAIGYFAGWW